MAWNGREGGLKQRGHPNAQLMATKVALRKGITHAELETRVAAGEKLCGGRYKLEAGETEDDRRYCSKPPMPNGRCKKHGGNAPIGPASIKWQGRGLSKYMPANLAPRYEEFLQDSELLNLRPAIALADTRTADLLSRIDFQEAGTRMVRAKAAADQLRDEGVDTLKGKRLLTRLLDTLDAMDTDVHTWREIQSTLEGRRRLVETEQKRLTAMQQMITVEEAVIFQRRIFEIIKEHVPQESMGAVANAMLQIMNHGAAPQAKEAQPGGWGREVPPEQRIGGKG